MKKRYVLKNKKRFYIFLLTSVLLIACISAGASVYGYDSPAAVSVTVKAGDTLWSIAKDNYEGGDIRKHIHKIRIANHMDSSSIYPGQTLIIPQ